jgi:hypothetical protein
MHGGLWSGELTNTWPRQRPLWAGKVLSMKDERNLNAQAVLSEFRERVARVKSADDTQQLESLRSDIVAFQTEVASLRREVDADQPISRSKLLISDIAARLARVADASESHEVERLKIEAAGLNSSVGKLLNDLGDRRRPRVGEMVCGSVYVNRDGKSELLRVFGKVTVSDNDGNVTVQADNFESCDTPEDEFETDIQIDTEREIQVEASRMMWRDDFQEWVFDY